MHTSFSAGRPANPHRLHAANSSNAFSTVRLSEVGGEADICIYVGSVIYVGSAVAAGEMEVTEVAPILLVCWVK